VVLQRVTVRDVATARVLTFPERGQPFTIRMSFEVREPITDVNVAFRLVDELGVIIIDDTMRDGRADGRCPGSPEPMRSR